MQCSWLEGVLGIVKYIAESLEHQYWLHIADIPGLVKPGQQPYLLMTDKVTFCFTFL